MTILEREKLSLASLLDQLKAAKAEKRPGLAKKKLMFHHDNTPVQTCWLSEQKLADLRYEIFPHAAYLPVLASSDYHLFPKPKNFLSGQNFQSNKEVILEVNAYFEDLEETHFLEAIQKLQKRWDKCVDLRGDYVEQ